MERNCNKDMRECPLRCSGYIPKEQTGHGSALIKLRVGHGKTEHTEYITPDAAEAQYLNNVIDSCPAK